MPIAFRFRSLATSAAPTLLLALVGCGTPLAPPPALCAAAATPVGTVQGREARSPLVGREVTVRGTVVGDFQATGELGGFFLQGTPDEEAASSEGIFVEATEPDVTAGDAVAVRGWVEELDRTTALVTVEEVARCGTASVAPALVELPAGRFERRESMLVSFPQSLAVTDLHDLGRLGRITLVSGGRLLSPTNVPPGGGTPDRRNRRYQVVVDDGRRSEPAVPLPHVADRVPRVGDTVTGATGVLVDGKEGWALHPVAPLAFAPRNPRPLAPPRVPAAVRVVSLNVLNYFTTLGERGAATGEDLERQRAKIVAALSALDADVVALLELENRAGSPRSAAAADLVAGLDARLGAGSYAVAEDPPGGLGGDEIRVGLLYRPARLSPIGAATPDRDPVFVRPPLAQTFAFGEERFTVVVAHLKSKRCDGATGDDADRDDGQGCWNGTRIRQARQLLAFVDGLARASGDRDVLLVGDLNAQGGEDPVEALRAGGLVDLSVRFLAAEDRYSYVFQGRAGQLDHAFATPNLASRVGGVAIWHINADEAPFLAYDGDGHPDAPVAADAFRSSDHDPVIVGFGF